MHPERSPVGAKSKGQDERGGNPCILRVAPVGAKSKGQDEREREGLLLSFLRTRESSVFSLTNRKAKTLDSRLKMSGMTEGLKTLDSSQTPDYKRRRQAILNRGSSRVENDRRGDVKNDGRRI